MSLRFTAAGLDDAGPLPFGSSASFPRMSFHAIGASAKPCSRSYCRRDSVRRTTLYAAWRPPCDIAAPSPTSGRVNEPMTMQNRRRRTFLCHRLPTDCGCTYAAMGRHALATGGLPSRPGPHNRRFRHCSRPRSPTIRIGLARCSPSTIAGAANPNTTPIADNYNTATELADLLAVLTALEVEPAVFRRHVAWRNPGHDARHRSARRRSPVSCSTTSGR